MLFALLYQRLIHGIPFVKEITLCLIDFSTRRIRNVEKQVVLSYHEFTSIDLNTASIAKLKSYAYTALLYEDTGHSFVPHVRDVELSTYMALQPYEYHPIWYAKYEPNQTSYTCSHRVKGHTKKETFELYDMNRITFRLQDGVYEPNGCIKKTTLKYNPIPCRIMHRKIQALTDETDLEQHRRRFALVVPKPRRSKITIKDDIPQEIGYKLDLRRKMNFIGSWKRSM